MQVIFTLSDALSGIEDADRLSQLRAFVKSCSGTYGLHLEIERAVEKIFARQVVAGVERAQLRGRVADSLTMRETDSLDVQEFMDVFLPDCLGFRMDADAARVFVLGRIGGQDGTPLEELVIGRLPGNTFSLADDALLMACALCAQAGAALLREATV